MITLQDVSLLAGSRQLLCDASLSIHAGETVGIIGANGCGKSTLLQLLLGHIGCDEGQCQVPAAWRIAHMAQEIVDVERSALDYVLDGDQVLRELQRRIDSDEHHGEALAALYEAFEHCDGYTADSRARQLLNGLGFAAEDADKPTAAFSGGWRVRLNLARALMCPSDLLLLDEPTNHLDIDATVWLEQWLRQYRGTLLIISHDRDFLDNLVDVIVSFEQSTLQRYSGNYSAFERQRAERLAQQQANFERQQERVKHIEDFVRRFRAKASKARQAQSRLKELARMEQLTPAHVDSPFQFTLPAADKLSHPLLALDQLEVGHNGKALLSPLSESIQPDMRIGLLGANGEGKSTLMATLAGELAAVAGQMHRGEHLRIGYFAQHQMAALDMNASPLLHLQRLDGRTSEQKLRDFIGGFGFPGERALAAVKDFSGGEKARLALALIAWQRPNLLLLDEPTNHLDLEMRHALTMAVQDFAGAVIVISHDRHLLRATVDEFWLVADGRVSEFDGDLSDYQALLSAKKLRERKSTGDSTGSGRSALALPLEQNHNSQLVDGQVAALPNGANQSSAPQDKRQARQQAARQREQLRPLTSRCKNIEKQMEGIQKRLGEIESALADSQLYQEDKADQLQQLLREQGTLQPQLDDLENDWLALHEEIELLQQNCEQT